MTKPQDLGYGISLLDVMDLGREKRTGTYVIQEEKLTIIETSASPSIPYLLQGLEELGLKAADIQYIIVTHIHLDHAGGAGLLLEKCPNAKVIVHPRGKRHLVDPQRLIQGAKAVYGEKFEEFFEPVLPIPEERLIVKQDGETLEIGYDRVLTFLDTPGHAYHHFSIYDPKSNGIFTGDTVGIIYNPLLDGIDFYLPTTSPNHFNPEAMLKSADRIENLGISRIYFGHFGMSEDPAAAFKHLRYWLPIFVEAGQQAADSNIPFEKKIEAVYQTLKKKATQYLDERNVARTSNVYEILDLDLKICSMGIVDYFEKRMAKSEK
ncbi:MAG: MBL fold metallo-hydrolase [Bacillales bacterium]|nr:MBL fold metallo-hydrolase [Bacillales bacterium]